MRQYLTNKIKERDSFSEVEYKLENPVKSFDMHTLTSLLYMLQCMNESTRQHVVPQQSAQNTAS